MGLVDRMKSALMHSDGDGGGEAPAAAHFKCAPGTIYSPTVGTVVSLEEVNDEAISKGYFGKGVGIVPGIGVVYAPVSGRIDATTVTNHAIGIMAGGGIDVLIHIGIDTVDMDGEGFTRFVEANQEVKAGEPLITFDRAAIREAGHDDVVTVVVTNPDDFGEVEDVAESGTIIAGHPLVKIGDPILFVNER